MLSLEQFITPNKSEVTSKVMDGEAIMINLASGVYYSMDKVGGTIWEAIEQGRRLDQILECVRTAYDVSEEQARTDLENLVNQLLEENLIVLQEKGEPLPQEGDSGPSTPGSYEPPVLNSYRDMGDLLALDPPMPGMAETPWQNTAPEESKHTG